MRGVLKGCATPGFDVAAGAPEGERGVAVVEVSAVMGVERRRGVVVKARAREGARRERQRVQIMVVGVLLLLLLLVYVYVWRVPMALRACSFGSSRC